MFSQIFSNNSMTILAKKTLKDFYQSSNIININKWMENTYPILFMSIINLLHLIS